VCRQLHAPVTLLPGTDDGWTPEVVWTFWGTEKYFASLHLLEKKKNLSPVPGFEPRTIQQVS